MSVLQTVSCPQCSATLSFNKNVAKKIALRCACCSNVFNLGPEQFFETEVFDRPSEVVAQPTATQQSAAVRGVQPLNASIRPTVVANAAVANAAVANAAVAKVAVAKVAVAKVAASPTVRAAVVVEEEGIVDGLFANDDCEDLVITSQDIDAAQALSAQALPLRPKLPTQGNAKRRRRKSIASRADDPYLPNSASSDEQRTTKRPSRAYWKSPLVLAATICVVVFVGLSFAVLNSLGGEQSEAVGCAEELGRLVQQSVDVLQVAEDATQRDAANLELGELQKQMDALVYRALKCQVETSAEELQPVKDTLGRGADLRFEFLSLTRKMGEDYAVEDRLAKNLADLRSAVAVVEQHLNYSLVELSSPKTVIDRTCVASIELKRTMLQELNLIDSVAAGLAGARRLQTLGDSLDQLAGHQSDSGQQRQVMGFEYEQADRAADLAKAWMVRQLDKQGVLSEELQYTLDEIRSSERRMKTSFRNSVPKLATSTRQRVQARLDNTNAWPKNSTGIVGNQSVDSTSVSSVNPPQRLAASQWKRPSASAQSASAQSASAQSASAQSASAQTASAQTASNDKSDGDDSFDPATVASTDDYDPSTQPDAVYTGASSVQIKLMKSGAVDCSQLAQELASAIGAQQVDVQRSSSGDQATISMIYAGPLDTVATEIRFGKVEICDSQSRTLFVVAR